MPRISDQVDYLIGDETVVWSMREQSACAPFDEEIVAYLDRVSKLLLHDDEAKKYSDVATFAFWCRKASILSYKNKYSLHNRLGRGLVFHIAPSNVPVNFAYSLASSLLAGNANIVRIPSKDFEQTEIICKALRNAMNDEMKKLICLVRYGHLQSVTDFFSAICDTRIIWGGNQTITRIRQSMLKPRGAEIAFSDRYSICIINADAYLNMGDKKKAASDFYNDTYLTDQNACTSPKLIVWIGERIAEAQDMFWDHLNALVKEKYAIQPIQVVNKYTNICRQAIKNSGLRYIAGQDMRIVRVQASELTEILMEDNGNSGYFIEYIAGSLAEILPICGLECQTMSYYGINEDQLRSFLMRERPKGIDRVTPIGKAMDFNLVWDGFDLIMNLSREIGWA